MALGNSFEVSAPPDYDAPSKQLFRSCSSGFGYGKGGGRQDPDPSLAAAKSNGEHFAMLTAYEKYMAEFVDQAGIEVLLVGDSASNNVFGDETSLPVTVDELLPLRRAVAPATKRPRGR